MDMPGTRHEEATPRPSPIMICRMTCSHRIVMHLTLFAYWLKPEC
jgi:hypothetical protein